MAVWLLILLVVWFIIIAISLGRTSSPYVGRTLTNHLEDWIPGLVSGLGFHPYFTSHLGYLGHLVRGPITPIYGGLT